VIELFISPLALSVAEAILPVFIEMIEGIPGAILYKR